jgi:stringent starvation protein B
MNSQRPYLVRAIHEWIGDNDETPLLLVDVEREGVVVPSAFVKDGRIVLNISPGATDRLTLGNECIAFSARFNGIAEEIEVPVGAVLAVYSRESQHGMLFAAGEEGGIGTTEDDEDGDDPGPDDPDGGGRARNRAHLRVVK